MSRHVDQIAIGYIARAVQNPTAERAIYREAAEILMGHAADPQNTEIAPALIGWASRFHGAAGISAPGRPAAVIDFLDYLQERAEAYRQVGSPYDDMGLIAREREIHEERSPGLPRVSIAPKSVHAGTRMGDQVTLKWNPTEADVLAGIRQQSTLALWQGHKEESQAVTIDTAVLDQPIAANATYGPRPYIIVSFGSEGSKTDVRMDVGQRCTVVASYVSVFAGLNPPRADFQLGQITIGASIGFFAAPSVAPVILTEYIDDLSDVAPSNVSSLIARPVKAMYLQPIQSTTIGGTATVEFYAVDGTIVQTAVPFVNGSQNVPIPLTADIAFLKVTNTGAGPRFRLPFQLACREAMTMYEIGKIPGPVLMGFEDSFVGIAAVKRPPPGKPKPSPQKRGTGTSSIKAGTSTKYGPAVAVKPSENVKTHGRVLTSARSTAAKAVKAALNAMGAAKAKPRAPAVSQAKRALIGAALQQPNKLTAKQQQALAKQKAAATKAGQLAKAAAVAGQKAKKAAINLAKKAVDQKTVAVNLRKRGATRVRGIEIGALLEEYYTQVGAAPDPTNPGYLDDGSPDPAYFGDTAAAADDAAMSAIDTGFEVPMDTAVDLPPPPDISHVFADMEAVGGIPYDGSRGTPPGYVGSLNYFTEKAQGKSGAFTDWYGYIFGGDPNRPSWPGEDPNTWIHVHGHHTGHDWWNNTTLEDALTSPSKMAPNSVSYGPLVGNPAMKDFAGMRVDAKGRMFWLPQEAPDWLTFPLKQAAALTAKAEKEAADAAAKANAAAMAKQQADAALAQAQQDAANALAESQAASEQAIAQAQQATQAQQVQIDQAKLEQQTQAQQQEQDVQAQQLLAQQAQMELERQREQSQMEMEQRRQQQASQQEAQQMLLAAARREQEYLAQHPEEEFAQQPEAEEGQGEEAGEEASADEVGYDDVGYYEE